MKTSQATRNAGAIDMRRLLIAIAFAVLLLISGCEVVDHSDYSIIQKAKSGQYAMIQE